MSNIPFVDLATQYQTLKQDIDAGIQTLKRYERVALSVLGGVVLILLIWWWWKRRRSEPATEQQPAETATPETSPNQLTSEAATGLAETSRDSQ